MEAITPNPLSEQDSKPEQSITLFDAQNSNAEDVYGLNKIEKAKSETGSREDKLKRANSPKQLNDDISSDSVNRSLIEAKKNDNKLIKMSSAIPTGYVQLIQDDHAEYNPQSLSTSRSGT